MKKTVLIAGFLLLGVVVMFAQQKEKEGKLESQEIPALVKDSFKKLYPLIKDVDWENEDDDFEASFEQKGNDISILFDSNGKLIEVETEIKKSELPASVKETIARDYAGYKIKEAAKIDSSGTITYEAEVGKGKKNAELIFDSQGNLLKEIDKEEKGDDETDND